MSLEVLRYLCGKQLRLILRCADLLQQTALVAAQGRRS